MRHVIGTTETSEAMNGVGTSITTPSSYEYRTELWGRVNYLSACQAAY